MPELVTTNLSFFEFEAVFDEPNIRMWLDRVTVVEAIYAALRDWNITVDDIEVIQQGKPSDQGVNFKIPEKRAAFFFGAGSCRFTRDSTSWESAEETAAILEAALNAFLGASRTRLQTFKTSVSLHIQPRTRRFTEILGRVLPPRLAELEPEQVKTLAAVVKWPYRRVTVDGSGQIANGVFLRYERDFPAGMSFEQMAIQLHQDEEQLFNMLDIQEA